MFKTKISKIISGILIIAGALAPAILPAINTNAVTCPNGSVNSSADSYAECNTERTDGDQSLMSRVKVIINFVLGLLGVVAVAMIILGGIQYTTSQGNPEAVTKAKNIIVYSVVGLVVALLGFAIVNFMLQNVFN